MAYLLAIAVGLGSFILYIAAFFFPEVHRKRDFLWSGVGFFYALVLWVCAGRITGGVLLGQTASVTLLGWFGWQTLQMRRQLTPKELQTLPDSTDSLGQVVQRNLTDLWQSLQRRLGSGSGNLLQPFVLVKGWVQGRKKTAPLIQPGVKPGTAIAPPTEPVPSETVDGAVEAEPEEVGEEPGEVGEVGEVGEEPEEVGAIATTAPTEEQIEEATADIPADEAVEETEPALETSDRAPEAEGIPESQESEPESPDLSTEEVPEPLEPDDLPALIVRSLDEEAEPPAEVMEEEEWISVEFEPVTPVVKRSPATPKSKTKKKAEPSSWVGRLIPGGDRLQRLFGRKQSTEPSEQQPSPKSPSVPPVVTPTPKRPAEPATETWDDTEDVVISEVVEPSVEDVEECEKAIAPETPATQWAEAEVMEPEAIAEEPEISNWSNEEDSNWEDEDSNWDEEDGNWDEPEARETTGNVPSWENPVRSSVNGSYAAPRQDWRDRPMPTTTDDPTSVAPEVRDEEPTIQEASPATPEPNLLEADLPEAILLETEELEDSLDGAIAEDSEPVAEEVIAEVREEEELLEVEDVAEVVEIEGDRPLEDAGWEFMEDEEPNHSAMLEPEAEQPETQEISAEEPGIPLIFSSEPLPTPALEESLEAQPTATISDDPGDSGDLGDLGDLGDRPENNCPEDNRPDDDSDWAFMEDDLNNGTSGNSGEPESSHSKPQLLENRGTFVEATTEPLVKPGDRGMQDDNAQDIDYPSEAPPVALDDDEDWF